VGLFTATCSGGTDKAGNAAATTAVSYTVGYNFVGFFQPINDPAGTSPSVFKQGSTIPVKFALLDSAGRRVADSVGQAIANACQAKLTWAKANGASGSVSEPVSSNPANDGNCFRYDAPEHQFIFNLGTKNMTTGGWQLTATVTAGGTPVATHSVVVTLR